MSMATSIFAVPELLEHILSELPPLEIIRCRRVSIIWRDLIATSPLLLYRTWLYNEILDPAYLVRSEDFIPIERLDYQEMIARDDYPDAAYEDNLSWHVHPIVFTCDTRNPHPGPDDAFDPLRDMAEDGFGGYFEMRPIVICELIEWCNKHKATEHIWGTMSLCRPDARVVHWQTVDSTGNHVDGIKLEAVQCEDPVAGT